MNTFDGQRCTQLIRKLELFELIDQVIKIKEIYFIFISMIVYPDQLSSKIVAEEGD